MKLHIIKQKYFLFISEILQYKIIQQSIKELNRKAFHQHYKL